MSKKLTQAEFIAKSLKVHGNNYDYTLVEYNNSGSKIVLICNKCASILEQLANDHLRGRNCCRCYSSTTKSSTDTFIREAIEKYGPRYDYSLVEYKGSHSKVKVICSIHGIFEQSPTTHLKIKHGCPVCGTNSGADMCRFTRDMFVDKANEVHNNFYTYDKVVYTSSNDKIIITCPLHGDFYSTPSNHIRRKSGCYSCGATRVSEKLSHTTNYFISLATKKYNNFFSYAKTNYISSKIPVIITCPIHGDFEQSPTVHLKNDTKYGCVSCYQDSQFGSNNGNWKGGYSYKDYCSVWSDKGYKADIRERDNSICQNPYCFKTDSILAIHHIDYDKKNCHPSNLITVCNACNSRANKDRAWHTYWYQTLLYKKFGYRY